MKSLRIALCGPNLEANERLKDKIGSLISPFQDSISYISHPLASLIEKTRSEEWKEKIDEMNLYSNVLRAIEQIRLEDEDVVISSSCGIDCVALQAAWLADQAVRIDQKTKLLGADGQILLSKDHVMFNKTGSILQAILNQAEEEAVEYWDFIYAPIASASLLTQHTQNDVLAQYEDFLSTVPAFSKVMRLPPNFTAALDFLEKEVDKWKTHIGLSS